MDIVVLAGGLSGERDVSFQTGKMVAGALRENGHRVVLLDVFMGYGEKEEDISGIFAQSSGIDTCTAGISDAAPDLDKVKAERADKTDCFFGPNVIAICRRADIVFLALHGEDGENGKIQAAFDLFGIRYTGSGSLGSALAMDKGLAKLFFRENKIPSPEGIKLEKSGRAVEFAQTGLSLPCVVKPCCGGSSIGVSVVQTEEEFQDALDKAFYWEDTVIAENYIKGREFSVAVVDGKPFPVIEIAPLSGFYDYQNKYKAGNTVETCPADLPAEIAEKMQEYAKTAGEALGLSVYYRADFLLDEADRLFCLEVNTLPGMTPTSLIPQEAEAAGIGFPALCEKLIQISLKKYEGQL